MEEFLMQSVVQATPAGGGWCGPMVCGLWHWGFWLGTVLGVIGAIIMSFKQPTS